jgi:hypothetical protein
MVSPVLQLYSVPPVAVSVVDCPAQMTFVPRTWMTGSGYTFITRLTVELQPLASKPVTV